MNLLNLLMGSLTSGNSIDALAGKTGLSAAKLSKLLTAALPILLKFLTKNASMEGGAQALLGALGGHKETKSMADQIASADEEDGAKIVKHILGDEKGTVVSRLAKVELLSGILKTSSALPSKAPLLSGVITRTVAPRLFTSTMLEPIFS